MGLKRVSIVVYQRSMVISLDLHWIGIIIMDFYSWLYFRDNFGWLGYDVHHGTSDLMDMFDWDVDFCLEE